MEMILGTPDGTLGDMGHEEACFGSLRDSINLSAR
jgi:hypothetical protein